MPAAIRAASGKAEEEPILGLYRRRIRGPRGNVERLGCRVAVASRRGRGAFSWGGGQRRRSSSGRRGRRRRSTGQALVARSGPGAGDAFLEHRPGRLGRLLLGLLL